MYDINRRKNISGATVSTLIGELSELPQDAIVVCCGSIDLWLHVEVNDKCVCIDCDELDDCYET